MQGTEPTVTKPAPVALVEPGPIGSARGRRTPATMLVVGVSFCLSGMPALIYQTCWQRILALHSGVGIYSVSMIVAAFMAGLGLGSYLGGVWSARCNPSVALRRFAWVEWGIALLGAASGWLYYDLPAAQGWWLDGSSWRTAVGHFAALLPPTTLMGMSLPLLVRAVVLDVRGASRTIGYLYGVNVVGAAVGAAVTPWALIPLVGIRGTLLAGACGNVLAGLGAFWAGMRFVHRPSATDAMAETGKRPTTAIVHRLASQSAQTAEPAIRAGSMGSFSLWLVCYALGGLYALALEVVWFRICDVAGKSTAFTFGTVLAVYLFGLGIGSLVGCWWAPRLRRPLHAYLHCESLVLAFAAVAVAGLTWLTRDTGPWQWLRAYWRGYDGLVPGHGALRHLLVLYVALPAGLFALPTILMGLAFCALQRGVHDDCRTSGRKVGMLQAANIVGCVAGSLVAGLGLLAWLGTADSLRLLVATGVVFPLLSLWLGGSRIVGGSLAATLVLLAWLVPNGRAFWATMHGVPERAALVAEDPTGVVAVTPELHGGLRLSIDGKGNSRLPFHATHVVLGALPAAVHPAPHEIAVIGLGSGGTAWAAACRPETRHVAVFELCAPELRLLEQVARQGGLAQLAGLLRDDRVRVISGDGRHALARGSARYDMIEADAVRPNGAYSGNLYSAEFFRLCGNRLNPGGIMCTWAPTPRVRATFHRVFPHVIEFDRGGILVGSLQPLAIDLAAWSSRLEQEPTRDYLGSLLSAEVQRHLATALTPPPRDGIRGYKPNHDLFPRDEFLSRP